MMDEFDLVPHEEPFDPFGVMLFKALQVVAFLVFITLMMVAPDAKSGKVDTKAEFLVTISWPDGHPDDIDLFVQDPLGHIAFYRRREAGVLVLDRDDRGGANDFIMVGDKKVASPIRQEIVSIRGIVAGEYTVNVYHFTALTGKPVPVSVKVERLNPTVQVVHYDTIELHAAGEEKTAVRFTMDKDGQVTDINHEQKSLLRQLASFNGKTWTGVGASIRK
jgi:hypothetical protein